MSKCLCESPYTLNYQNNIVVNPFSRPTQICQHAIDSDATFTLANQDEKYSKIRRQENFTFITLDQGTGRFTTCGACLSFWLSI